MTVHFSGSIQSTFLFCLVMLSTWHFLSKGQRGQDRKINHVRRTHEKMMHAVCCYNLRHRGKKVRGCWNWQECMKSTKCVESSHSWGNSFCFNMTYQITPISSQLRFLILLKKRVKFCHWVSPVSPSSRIKHMSKDSGNMLICEDWKYPLQLSY